MSSVMLAAGSTAIEESYQRTTAPRALPEERGVPLLRRAWGLGSGLLFLAARIPVYIGLLLFGALVSLAGALLYGIQAIGLRLTRPAGALAVSALALVCIANPRPARADALDDTAPLLTASAPLQQTTLVFSQQTNLYAFQTDGPGTLSISLKDWGFPVSLQQLTASILSQDQVLGSWSSSTATSWQFEVPIQGSGVFDAFVAAQAGTFSGLRFGAYSMSINFEPASTVPLPPALDLLLGGMGLLGAMTLVERISRRRNRDVISLA
jgi:hypothetical protein